MAKKTDKDEHQGTIALNKRARHEYRFDERVEAGLALHGWEVKSLRAGRVNITDGYAMIKNNEIFLFGAQIMPLISASTHIHPDERRTRKLLLHREEIDRLVGQVERKGYTLIPTAMYWKNNRVKLELGLAQGKKDHDKRAAIKDREWQIEKARVMNAKNRDA
ncbi:MAG: SsrA-binding protein SmpB [Lysobacterales bacterium]